MERFVRGDIVVTNFPFSDLSSSIKRPSLIVANLPGEDLIICPITTKEREDSNTVILTEKDFKQGKLKVNSFIRAGKLVTLRSSLVSYKVGSLKKEKLEEVLDKIVKIFRK